jgi:hypothetical protein
MTVIETLYRQGLRALSNPRAAAADVMALGVPREALAPALLLVVALSVIVNTLSEALVPNPFVQISPFQMAALLAVMMTGFAAAIAVSGRMLGGHGTFRDSVLLMIFLQALFLPAAALDLLLLLLSPPLSGIFILGIVIFLTWVHLNFIAALHGFRSLGPALGVMIMGMIATFFLLIFVAPLLVTVTGDANV